MAKKDPAPFKIRMPSTLYRRIRREAARHGLTINAEIVQRLHTSFLAHLDLTKMHADDAGWKAVQEDMKELRENVARLERLAEERGLTRKDKEPEK